MLQTIKIPARNACLYEIRLFNARSSALFFPKENTAETISISHIHITPLYFQSVTGVTFSTYQISSMRKHFASAGVICKTGLPIIFCSIMHACATEVALKKIHAAVTYTKVRKTASTCPIFPGNWGIFHVEYACCA